LLVLALVLCEVAARLIFPVPEVGNFNRISFTPTGIFGGMDEISGADPTPPLGRSKTPRRPLRNVVVAWASEPDRREFSHALNLYGFRGPDFQVQPRDGVRRVLFLGDSFTEGFGAQDDETLPVVFERLSGERLEALNLGIAGNQLPHYTRLARVAIPLLKPDAVFLVLYANDFPLRVKHEPRSDSFAPRWNRPWTPRLISTAAGLAEGDTPALFYHQGPFPFFLPVPHPSNPLSQVPREPDPEVRPDIWRAMRRGRFNPFVRQGTMRMERELTQPLDEVTGGRSYLAEIRDLAAGVGASLVATYVPLHVTVSDYYYPLCLDMGVRFVRPTLVSEEYRRHQSDLAGMLGELGIPFVDPTEAMQAAEQAGQRLYVGYDPHLNAAGYRLLAEELLQATR
jgi:lysophospholipase L1-like esterase